MVLLREGVSGAESSQGRAVTHANKRCMTQDSLEISSSNPSATKEPTNGSVNAPAALLRQGRLTLCYVKEASK